MNNSKPFYRKMITFKCKGCKRLAYGMNIHNSVWCGICLANNILNRGRNKHPNGEEI